MRQFVLKATLLLLSATLIATLLNVIAPARDDTVVQVRTLIERGTAVEALALGNSHSLAIDFETLGVDGFHLWRGNGDSLEVAHQIDVLLSDLPNLQLALMPISYFTVHTDNGALDIRDQHRQIHYTSLPDWNYIDGDIANFILGKAANYPLWRMARIDHWEGDLRFIAGRLLGNEAWQQQDGIVTQADNIRFILRNPSISYQACDFFDEEALLAKATDPERSRALEAVAEQNEMLTAVPDVAERTYAALAQVTEQMEAAGVRLVFYTPPYAEIYVRQYDPVFIEATQALMTRLQRTHDVEYYDFSTQATYTLPLEHMLDEDHLNFCGAQAFSAYLREILQDRPAEGQ